MTTLPLEIRLFLIYFFSHRPKGVVTVNREGHFGDPASNLYIMPEPKIITATIVQSAPFRRAYFQRNR